VSKVIREDRGHRTERVFPSCGQEEGDRGLYNFSVSSTARVRTLLARDSRETDHPARMRNRKACRLASAASCSCTLSTVDSAISVSGRDQMSSQPLARPCRRIVAPRGLVPGIAILVEKSARSPFPPHPSLTSRCGSPSLPREVFPGGTRLLPDTQFPPNMAINLLVACSIIRLASRPPPIRQCLRVSVVSSSSTKGMRRPYNTPFHSSSAPVKSLRPKPPRPCVCLLPQEAA
jgi:hypothetical protein